MYGLYIHSPFCTRKCNYCDFVSRPTQQELLERYLAALHLEMQKYSGTKISTIFIGGGTPSVLSPSQIGELFIHIRTVFDCSDILEITYEANPESLTEEKLAALKTAGVNRLSLGIQSFNDDTLRTLGRVHDTAAALTAYSRARAQGFSNINLDLIYGNPGQSLEAWQEDLRQAVALAPEHLSLYPLTIEHGTPFFQQNVSTDEELQARMYEWSLEFLERSGYRQYEISNWSLPGFHCRHNLTYWDNRYYIGVGVAAASYRNGSRCKNTDDINEYIDLISRGENPVAEEDVIDGKTRLSEEIILKLRTRAGVLLSPEIRQHYLPAIEKLRAQNLLEQSGQNIRLTKQGLLLANQVMREFV